MLGRVSSQPAQHQLSLDVRWSEAGPGGWIKPASWLDYCMEAADANARVSAYSMTHVEALGYYWVMLRYRLAFEATPRVRETLRLTTWPRGFDRLFALREFRFATPEGTALARGTTAWLLVKKDGFRPVRPAEHIPPFPTSPEVGYLEKVEALPPLEIDGQAPALTLRARRDEIDLLGHVSNPHYVRWAVEALPGDDFLATHELVRLDVDFIGMAFAGDSVEVYTLDVTKPDEAAPAFHQVLRKSGEHRDLTRLHTVWRRR
jgi:medium-chain acyl-[acyl-carrier-protein] hydrolase